MFGLDLVRAIVLGLDLQEFGSDTTRIPQRHVYVYVYINIWRNRKISFRNSYVFQKW